ncbi:MAG TPA: tetratricopeptide repeat protein [Elusimicrobiota bacterium]|nr:tetratricopeptide repeat protein [Elusimicrobiota bacterium]
MTHGGELRARARAFSSRDAWKPARLFFEEEVSRRPSDAEARAYLGFFCVKESLFDTDRALAEFEKALDLDARCVAAHLHRAFTRGSLQRLEAAREDVSAAERLGATKAELAWARACVELDAGSVDEAIVQFARLVELDGDSTSMILLSQAHSQAGDNEAALEWAKRASERDPQDFRAPTYMGVYLAYLERYPEARAALAKAAAFGCEYALLDHTLAYVAGREGNASEEERHLRRALEADPEYVTSRKRLADLCAASGRVPEAKEHYRRALARFPSYREAKEALDSLG